MTNQSHFLLCLYLLSIRYYHRLAAMLCSWFERNCICHRDRKLDVYRLSLVTAELRWMVDPLSCGGKASHRFVSFKTVIYLRVYRIRISMVLETWPAISPKTSEISFREYDFRFVPERLFKLNRIRGRSWIRSQRERERERERKREKITMMLEFLRGLLLERLSRNCQSDKIVVEWNSPGNYLPYGNTMPITFVKNMILNNFLK